MLSSTILTIAIPILVALAGLVVFTTARRRDTDHALSPETVRQDRGKPVPRRSSRRRPRRPQGRAGSCARPAPGRHPISIVVIEGPPVGTNTTGQEAEGPHCVGAGD